jgi:hypothetical protein
MGLVRDLVDNVRSLLGKESTSTPEKPWQKPNDPASATNPVTKAEATEVTKADKLTNSVLLVMRYGTANKKVESKPSTDATAPQPTQNKPKP